MFIDQIDDARDELARLDVSCESCAPLSPEVRDLLDSLIQLIENLAERLGEARK